MQERVITDNADEKKTVRWDGTRFSITTERKGGWYEAKETNTDIYNPREMLILVDFARTLGGE